ncbi:hypothetical protein SAMN05444162_0984 [Paenibacillaceae bacterium GAS479]|nr:hypothetical protein SAMN05444162_0984 [Paenibacillaceae bacterium GAS479]
MTVAGVVGNSWNKVFEQVEAPRNKRFEQIEPAEKSVGFFIFRQLSTLGIHCLIEIA